jgi:hypothetical protein
MIDKFTGAPANAINDLVVKFYKLKTDKNRFHLLVLESLFQMQRRGFDLETNTKFLKKN